MSKSSFIQHQGIQLGQQEPKLGFITAGDNLILTGKQRVYNSNKQIIFRLLFSR